jgi:integrase
MKLTQCVEVYLGHKRACGCEYTTTEKFLRRFVQSVGNLSISKITDHQLDEFLSRTPISNNTWRLYCKYLKGFFVFWFARRQLRHIPKPRLIPGTSKAFYLHVYSRTDIRKLLKTAVACQRFPKCTLGPDTLKTIVLFLYGTGIKMRDAFGLLDSDVDFTNSIIRVRGNLPDENRIIPIGRDVKRLLKRHLRSDERSRFRSGRPLFLTIYGRAVPHSGFYKVFSRLRRIAKVERADKLSQPRVYDLRHTFAVHSIAHWNRRGLELNQLLPLLAAYMGNVNLVGVERYLDLSPCRHKSQLQRLKV